MTRREYERYSIFHRVKDNVLDVYDFNEWRYVTKISVYAVNNLRHWENLPYLGHIIEWLVNFQPN